MAEETPILGIPPADAPVLRRAASIQIWSCGHCPNAHILLLDASGRGFAEVILSAEQIQGLNAFRYAYRHNELPKGEAYKFLPRSP